MNWGDIATWAGSAGTLLAVLIAIWQAAVARRAAKDAVQSQNRAIEAAERAASAEERAAEAANRAAEAQERAANAARDSAHSQERIASVMELEANRYEAPWVVQHHAGQTFVLANDSDEPALEVRAMTDSIREPITEIDEIPPGSALQFWYVGHMGSDRFITVTWRRPSEEAPRTWRGAVPQSPR